MSQRAHPLHEEVVAAMYAERVDPFERRFHGDSQEDAMKQSALARERELQAAPVPSYQSTNLDFWKGFNTNQKYLQAKSAADLRKQARKKKQKPQKTQQVKPLSLPKHELKHQDQKTPARDLTCKFPPPPQARGEDVLVYEVEDLLKFANKKNSKGYTPKPLELIDPLMAGGGGFDEFGKPVGVVYSYNPEDDLDNIGSPTGGVKSTRPSPRDDKDVSGDVSGSRSGGAQDSFSHSELLVAGESGLVVGERDSFVLPPPTTSPLTRHRHESFASSSFLEKNSVVSASGTVVPSLNLSTVIASQISKSEMSKNEKGEDTMEDDITVENTFGLDENTNELDQQPSFAFTDNEDFLFQKSMMDGTLGTTTVMDDLTKQSTAVPIRKTSAKERRKQARARENHKKLLAPVAGCHGDIGCAARGGIMGQEPSRPKPERGYTETCTFPTVEELDAAGRKPKGGSFPFAKRFPHSSSTIANKGGSAVQCPVLATPKPDKGVFSETKRFKEIINANPAPGDYTLRRMFDDVALGKGKQLTADASHELVFKIEKERTLRNQSSNYIANQVVFGYGCSVEEHVKYGLCLDGLCGRRAKWEDVMLLNQDHERLGHGGGVVQPSSKKPNKGCSVSVSLSMPKKTFQVIEDLRQDLQADEKPDFSPLKTASLRGDFDTVVQLCLLGADINERDRLQQTILHQAVLRNYLHIIVCLTEVEGYSECLNDELKFLCLEKSRGMFRDWIDLNAQDCKGNTPLHIASMRGNSLMAEALCDAGADPDGIKNKEGFTSSDIAKTQRLFQIVRMAQAKYEARKELRSLRVGRKELKKRAAIANRNYSDREEVEDYEVYEQEEDEDQSEVETGKGEVEEKQQDGVTLLPVSKQVEHQHSYHVSYFGKPQEPKKKQSQRDKYARFLKMRK